MRLLLLLGLLLLLLLLLLASAQVAAPKKASPVPVHQVSASQSPIPRFKDVAKEVGLTVSHISTPEKKYIVESMSGGTGLIDCDNDGELDIITVNGSTVDRFRQGGDPMITLYHQDADFKFTTDITQSAGLTRKGWGMGVAVADYDNDGLQDIYVTGYGGNALYHNLGNCKFEDVTDRAGVAGGAFSTGAAWADYDRDGYVDLFVSRYVRTDLNHLPTPESNSPDFFHKGIRVENPWTMQGETDLLFHNRGDGTFEEVSRKAGVNDPARHYGLGVVWGDYDNDGWPDLYVANDSGPNYLYRNKHDGTFEEVGLLAGASLSADGQEQGSMGVDFGDFDHDGLLDIVVTNFAEQADDLYHNEGPTRGFLDLAWSSKIGQVVYPYVRWGTGFVDFDNDGWADIFVASGHVYPQVDSIANNISKYKQPMFLFRNKGDRTFEDITRTTGLSSVPLASRRGAAFGDVKNDGNIGILVLNVGAPPSLFIQDVPSPRHRVLFRLVGTKSNRAA